MGQKWRYATRMAHNQVPTGRQAGAGVRVRVRVRAWLPRPKDEIARMFNGRDLVEPGLVLVSRWRPDGEPGPEADQAWTYCGVAPV